MVRIENELEQREIPADPAGAQRRKRPESFCQTHRFSRLDLTHPPVDFEQIVLVAFPASFAATFVDRIAS